MQTKIAERGNVRLVTLREAEARTQRTISSWRRDIRLRKIPFVRVGKLLRIPEDFVNQLIAKGWHEPIDPASDGH